jgi:uncharacterized protein YndB with AHSA1/START domain
MANYTFVTEWRIEAPLQAVWEAILHSENWPGWWQGVESVVELQPGDALDLGNIRRYTWKSRLPYRLTFDLRTIRIEPQVALEGIAAGELEGTGRWHFSAAGPVTVVRYDWQVRTTKRWMNWLAPLARPFFKWNHDVVMRQGAQGLAQLLKARLVSVIRR